MEMDDEKSERRILCKLVGHDNNLDDILKYIDIQIQGYKRLAEITDDPLWYHAKIDAMQDLQSYIFKKYM